MKENTAEALSLSQLRNPDHVANCLGKAGLHPSAVQRLKQQFFRVAEILIRDINTAQKEAFAFFVPGRIEILGKHVDYAGGSSLVCTLQHGFCLIATPRSDRIITTIHAETGESKSFSLSKDLEPDFGRWSNYPMTVARRIARNFPGFLSGADIVFVSDLPQASGMSSSSAFMIAFFLALSSINRLPDRDEYRCNVRSSEDLAHYLATVENGQSFRKLTGDKGVGTFGGSQDHTAILCCGSNKISKFAYAPTRFELTLSFPEQHVFVIGSSGVIANKTGEAQEEYNRASFLAARAAEAWNTATGRTDRHLSAVISSPEFTRDRMEEILRETTDDRYTSEELLDRFKHFFEENEEIVPSAVKAIQTGDLNRFGNLVDRSQYITEHVLRNQTEETVFLASEARRLGAVASSAFGAGFGGSAWALVSDKQADTLCTNWSVRYREAYPETARRSNFFVDRAGPAAFQLGS